MKSLTFLLFVSISARFGLAEAGEIPAKAQDHPIALTGGTVHTVSRGEFKNATVIFDKGKITAIGADIEIPPAAEKIDVRGKHIYPGMIDARSDIGLVEIEAVRATRDLSETGSINPDVRAEVAVNPESEVIPVTRANGITVAVTMPSGGTISGTAAAIELEGWTWDEMTLKAPVGLLVNWPSMRINRAWWEQRSEEDQKKAREKSLDELRNAFRDARAYLQAKRSESGANTPHHKTDSRWETMAPVLDRKIPVMMEAEDLEQIEAAVAWAEQENVKLVIIGGYDSWRAANVLKEKGIPVIVNPIHRTPERRWELYDEPFTLPKKLYEAGVQFCIAGEAGASNERNVPYHAATAAAYGLPKDEALKSVTLYPAQILGIADRVGSLDAGKDATIIVTDGDPLEIMTHVQMEFIRGKKISLDSRHTHLYEKYKERYRRMSGH